MQQLFQFGCVPNVEACPPHGLINRIPQFCYVTIHGPLVPDETILGRGYMSDWLMASIGLVLVHAVLAPLAGALEAFVIIAFHSSEPLVHRPIKKCTFDWAILDAEGHGFAACIPVRSVRGEPERLCAKRAQPLRGEGLLAHNCRGTRRRWLGIGLRVPRPLCIQKNFVKCTLIY